MDPKIIALEWMQCCLWEIAYSGNSLEWDPNEFNTSKFEERAISVIRDAESLGFDLSSILDIDKFIENDANDEKHDIQVAEEMLGEFYEFIQKQRKLRP